MKKIYPFIMALFMAILFMGPLRAQMADEYSFEVSAESYHAIDGSVLYLSYPSSGSEELFLPFSFHYCGYNYTAIRVCADGLITFGSPPTPNNDLASAACYNVIAPLWDDLSQQTGISSITYTVEGTVPNRVFTIQYNQVFRMNANDYPLNFQVKFYETSNKIKFVYGNGFENYSASATDASIGINNRYGAEIYFLSIVPTGPGTADYSYTTALNNLDQTHFRNLSPGTAFTFTPNTDCLRPTVFTLGTVTHTSVHLSWYPFDAGNSWEILYGPTNFDPETGGTMVTAWNSNYTLNGLDTATAYDIYIRKRCDEEHSLWSRKARFTTRQNPAAIPYSCDFNQDTENARWTLSNSGVNDWIIGPLPEDTVNGNRALFISHDGGITHAYDGNRYAYSWAYRDIYFTPYTNYLLEFDWISNGEGTLDFLRVFIDNPYDMYGDDNQILDFLEGLNPIPGPYYSHYFIRQSSWTRYRYHLDPSYSGETKRVYFLWRNDASTANQPPAGIDNISITGIDCGRPHSLTASNINVTTATLSWTPARQTDYRWELVYGPAGFDPDTATPSELYVSSISLPRLRSNATYEVYVRTICENDEYSSWSEPLVFSTLCGRISDLPFSDDFNSYPTGANSMPPCWSVKSTSNGYPSIRSYSQQRCLNLSSNSGNYCIAVSPEFDISIPVSSIKASFKFRKLLDAYELTVGVMEDPNDESTFTEITTLSQGNSGIWMDCEVIFSNYTGSGQYIAFKSDRRAVSQSNSVYIDDLTFDFREPCISPSQVNVYNIMQDSARVNWVSRGEESNWEYVCVEHGDSPESGVIIETDQNDIPIAGLSPSTQYDIFVRADCDSSVSAWSAAVTFTTLCEAVSTLPVTENFENSPALPSSVPDCWIGYSSFDPSYPQTVSSYSCNGNQSGHLYCHTGTDYNTLLISPEIDAGIPLHELMVSFNIYAHSFGVNLKVGVMTNPYDISTFEEIAVIVPSLINRWEFNEIALGNYRGGGTYIAFMTHGSLGNNSPYIDDIIIDYAHECSDIIHLTIDGTASHSASLSWSPGQLGRVSEFMIEYRQAGQEIWEEAYTEENQYTLTNLEERTLYEVRVKSLCANSAESNFVYGKFLTGCDSSGYSMAGSGTIRQNKLPLSTGAGYSYTQQIFSPQEVDTGHIYGIAFQYFNDESQYKNSVSIYMSTAAQNDFAGTNDWIPLDSMHRVFSGDLFLNNHGADYWWEVAFDSVFFYNGSQNLVIAVLNNHGSTLSAGNYTFYTHSVSDYKSIYYQNNGSAPFDPANTVYEGTPHRERNNIKFLKSCESSNCPRPNLILSHLSSNEATFRWNVTGSEESWEFEYKADSANTWNIVPIHFTHHYYVLTGLANNTTYNVRMRSICSANENSALDHITFTTSCANIETLPYVENFDGVSNADIPPCWFKLSHNNTSDPVIVNHGSVTPLQSAQLSSGSFVQYSALIMPALDDSIRIRDLQISFRLRKESELSSLQLGAMSDPYDISTFTLIHAFIPETVSEWERFEYFLNGYNGNASYLAFRSTGISTVLIDDITVDYLPQCEAPSDIVFSDAGAYGADISWTQNGNETQWELLYGPAGSIQDNDIPLLIDGEPAAHLDLIPSTLYDLYIRTFCDLGNYSNWTRIQFMSGCAAITEIPYTEDFDNWGTGTLQFPMPDCWHKFSTYNPNHPFINTIHFSSPGALQLTSDIRKATIAVTPEIASGIRTDTLSLHFKMRSSNRNFPLKIGVMTDPSNDSTFVLIDSVFSSRNDQWEQIVVYANDYQGNGHHFAFKNENPGSVYIDDLSIEYMPACPRPSGISILQTGTHDVTLDWMENGSAQSWLIEVEEVNGNVALFYAQNKPHYLAGLLPNTSYNIYIRSICGQGDTSVRSNGSHFTTYCESVPVPYTENFDLYTGSSYNVSGPLPSCWYSFTDDPSFPKPHIVAEGSYAYVHSGTNALSMAAGIYGNNAYVVLPEFSERIENIILTFWSIMEDTDYGTLQVGYLEGSQNDIASFQPIGTVPSTGIYTEQTIDFSEWSIPGNARFIAFQWNNSQGRYTCCLDDIRLALPSSSDTCTPPAQLSVTQITQTGALLSWLPGGEEEKWILEYKASSDPNFGNPVYLDSTSYHFTGLQPLTMYNIRLRSVCSETLESESASVSFTTLYHPFTYTIHAVSGPNGTITPSGYVEVTEGSDTTFLITPNPDYKVENIWVDNIPYEADSVYIFRNVRENHTIEVRFILSVTDRKEEKSVTVYPNPAHQYLHIETKIDFDRIQITNLPGQVIYRDFIRHHPLIVDIQNYVPGIYFISLFGKEGTVTKKFVKE